MSGEPESLQGRQLGPYTVGRRLGAGGIGAVYEAIHSRTGRPYALKVLLPEAAGEQGLERFRREARALGALGHVGIVGIHDFDTAEDGTAFMVMDRLEGCDLADRLETEPLSLRRALELFDEICAGLACAHAAGILHRDLKPSNVFLAKQPGAPERAVLLDFGLAKSVDGSDPRLTATGATMGTPLYMAPEQARGVAVDQRTDVYALGCILYEMLGGRPPFTGPTLTAILSKVLTEPPPPLRSFRPDVPAPLEAVISRALAKDPSQRPHSVEAFQREVAAAMGGPTIPNQATPAAIAATQISTAPEAPRPPVSPFTPQAVGVQTTGAVRAARKPRWALIAGIGTLLLVATIGAGVGAYYFLDFESEQHAVAEVIPAAPVPTAAPSPPTETPEAAAPMVELPEAPTPAAMVGPRPARMRSRPTATTPPTPPPSAPAAAAPYLEQQQRVAQTQIQAARERISTMERFRPLLRAHRQGLSGGERPRWCSSPPNLAPFRQDMMVSSLVSNIERMRTELCGAFETWDNPPADVRANMASLGQKFTDARQDIEGLSDSRITDAERQTALQQLAAAKRKIENSRRFPCMASEINAITNNMQSRVRRLGSDVRRICNALGVNRIQGQQQGLRQVIDSYDGTLDQLIAGQRQIIATFGGT